MRFNFPKTIHFYILCVLIFPQIIGCLNPRIRANNNLNIFLAQSSISLREPSLGDKVLVALTKRNGKDFIELIDIRTKKVLSIPGLNNSNSQPISVAVNAKGDKVVFIQQRDNKTELLLYRRSLGSLEKLELIPKGIPRRVSIDGIGRLLAVQVSRDGRWDIDLIRLSR